MSGQWPALALAIVVHVVFISVLVFSLRWQNRPPEPITAELYAPPTKVATIEPPAPPPASSAPAGTRASARAQAGTQARTEARPAARATGEKAGA
jgi:colicin import membrane protein